MDRVYVDSNGHVWYATLNENGKSTNQRIFANDEEEKMFLHYLRVSPASYSIHALQLLYNEYKSAKKIQ